MIGRHKLAGFSEPAELYSLADGLLNGVLHIGQKTRGFHVADMRVENNRVSGS
jgi:hypothetical protein